MVGIETARPAQRRWVLPAVAGAALLALGGVALWLRWRYVRDVGLYVDEFTTMWGATKVLEHGWPAMPSGVLYTRGLLNTYVVALFGALAGGITYSVGRLPSVIFGLAAVAAIFWIGRREWNARVGWLAAVGLALLPEAIEWSGRARFYSQLMFFVLLAVWAAWDALRPAEGQNAPPTWRKHLLFALYFALALFSQEETLLLYPSILLGMLLWRGIRYMLRPPVVVAQLLCLAALGLRYAVEVIGQPGYFETIQSQRPYIGLALHFASSWDIYGPLFVAPERLPWTILGLLAVGVALAALPRARWRLGALSRFDQASLFFGLQLFLVLLIVLGLVGSTWRESRYLLIIQPFWLLIGAAGAIWLVDRLTRRDVVRWAATGLLSIAAAALFWRPVQAVLHSQPEGYDRVLAYVAEHRQPGDVIMTPQPPACALVLGPCDYYATQRGYDAYIIPKDGQMVDRWSGSALLNDPAQLRQVIQTAPRVWMVVDGQRLGRRYRTEFLDMVVQQFDIAHEERGTFALMAEGWREPPEPAVTSPADLSIRFGPMELVHWERTEAVPGEPLHVKLLWDRAETIWTQYNTSVQVAAADGTRITNADGPPGRGMTSTYDFASSLLPDPKVLLLPADLPDGRYRIDLVVYDLVTGEPQTPLPVALDWFVVGEAIETSAAAQVLWSNGLGLHEWEAVPEAPEPGRPLDVRVIWSAAQPIDLRLTATVQLLGPDGAVIAQSDREPEGGFYPTDAWNAGEPVADTYRLELPSELPSGAYRLLVGWYDPVSGARIPLQAGGDIHELAAWER